MKIETRAAEPSGSLSSSVMIEWLPWLRRSTKTCLVAMTCSLLITAYSGGISPLSRQRNANGQDKSLVVEV